MTFREEIRATSLNCLETIGFVFGFSAPLILIGVVIELFAPGYTIKLISIPFNVVSEFSMSGAIFWGLALVAWSIRSLSATANQTGDE